MGAVKWSADAREDLHRIMDVRVCAEILDLAETELTAPDSSQPGFEGRASNNPDIFYRRAVRRRALDDFLGWHLIDENGGEIRAYDYVLAYRYVTEDEIIKFRLELITVRSSVIFRRRGTPPFVVLRVLHNREFARLYSR